MEHSAEDAALLAELGALVRRLDPVPEQLDHAAYAARVPAITRRLRSDVDAPVTELAGVRGTGQDRVLRFHGDGLSVQLMLCQRAERTLRILGVLTPSRHRTVTACWPGGSLRTPVEEHGRFVLGGVPCGPLRLEVDDVARTEWFLT